MSLKRLAKSLQPKRVASERTASSFDVRLPLDSPDTDDSAPIIPRRAEVRSYKSRESYQDDDSPLADDITITEGGWICRVERFEKHVDSRGHIHYRRPSKKTTLPFLNQDPAGSQEPQNLHKDKVKKGAQQSIISYVHYNTEAGPSGLVELEAYIEIKSPLILQVLRENANDYNHESLRASQVTLHEPYPLLWHQYHALETYLEDQSNPKDSRTHIKVLLDFLRSCDMPNVPELIALCKPKTLVQSISYASLWFLFIPGTLVVKQKPYLAASLVFEVRPPARQIDRKGQVEYDSFELRCRRVVYNGVTFTYQEYTEEMEPFPGLLPLSELEVVPLSLLEGHEEKRASLISRGRKFWGLRGQHMQEYVDRSHLTASLVENERVMVDWATHTRRGTRLETRMTGAGDNESTRGILDGYQPGVEVEVEERYARGPDDEVLILRPRKPLALSAQGDDPDDEVLILCPCFVWAFSFLSKRWYQYHVDDLVDVDFNKRSFERLVLREDYKTLLKSMVAQHFTQGQNRFRDLVAGKGQGLNILLHGPPGVGKTLTAECIADLYERPLYSVTSGDIGTDPTVVEGKLHEIFYHAVTWNAVLLLDEADVFLAERNLENLSRNALVSVFLRCIEYFNGVFFLTTNRVGTVDEAFQSRLHITLGLDPLSVEDRRKIWYHFIKDLKHLSQDDRRVLARHARDDWSHQDFNGRQIRNTVKTALTLARQDGVEVQARHFKIVLDIGTRFAGYMQRLKKMDRERLAEAIGTRLDVSANTLQSPEIPVVARTSKKRDSDNGLEQTKNESDLDYD